MANIHIFATSEVKLRLGFLESKLTKYTNNMKNFSALALAVLSLTGMSVQAQDFTVLTTPADVYANSIEDETGAKATFKAVLDDAASTDEQKVEAMQTYMQKASPKPGYGFDMSFLLSYNAVTEANKNTYTQAKLAEVWKTDVPEVVFGANSVLASGSTSNNEIYLRVNAPAQFKLETSFNKFAAYQTVTLSEGSYQLSSLAFVNGLANAANLAAGENLGSNIAGLGNGMKTYTVNFKMDAAKEIKLGYVRNETAGNLNYIAFNNMYLYKVSDIIAITDDAAAGLSTAENVNVQVCREFKADEYTPVCLPFKIENWKDVFADVLAWNDYAADKMVFKTISGANTQARKPYLVKTKTDITADNYLTFRGVNIEMGSSANPSKPGTWVKSVEEGQPAFPVVMTGNWAAGTVPANCYYYDGADATWKLSDGTAPLKAFSAYMEATALTDHPATVEMSVNPGASTIINTIASDDNAVVNVYNMQGVTVRKGVTAAEATTDLPAGMYIVGNRKVIVK